ncbi:hypothetical protein AGMMS49992_10770 [Clostridia bacterium]|nr:hypothetical protein AGMMS49992_10770 [Clostridia bacterium]
MKRFTILVLALVMLMTAAPSLAQSDPLAPMETPITLKVVADYSSPSHESLHGETPETFFGNDMLKNYLGITLDWMWVVPADQVQQKLQLSLASGYLPDVLMLGVDNEPMYLQLLEADMLRDLTDAWEEWGLQAIKDGHELLDNRAFDEIAIDGRIYAIPSNDDTLLSTQLIYYRKDWADTLGITQPTNRQELLDMAYAFAEGYPDKFPIGAYNNPLAGNSLNWVFECFGAYPKSWLKKDGVLEYGAIQPEMLDALIALSNLYKSGAIDKEFATKVSAQNTENVVGSRVGIMGHWWYYGLSSPYLNKTADLEAEWACLPILDENGMGYAVNPVKLTNAYCLVLKSAPVGAEEALVKMININYDWHFGMTEEMQMEAYPEIAANPENVNLFTWFPAYVTPPSMYREQWYNVNAALESGDPSKLIIPENVTLYEEVLKLPTLDRADEEYPMAWGWWFSRAAKDSGIGMAIQMADAGHIIQSEFYGAATPTEQDRFASLDSMLTEYVSRFIMGEVDETSWQEFVNNWQALGGSDWTSEVNEQWKALQ